MRGLLLLVSLSVILAAGVGATPRGQDPERGAAPDVIGLYIGIGEYTAHATPPLTLHETNRKRLLPLFEQRFGVRWMPSALDQNREGVRDALLALLAEVRANRANGRDTAVLVFYTGHGSRVTDQDGDEQDGLDETLVPVDGGLADGVRDIRDDDIDAFRAALADAGAHMTLIVEACHSETVYRGGATTSLARGGFPPGPTSRLFESQDFDRFYDREVAKVESFVDRGQAESFVCISAASDREVALAPTIKGEQWGMLSLALYRVLSECASGWSNAALFDRVERMVVRLRAEHSQPRQTPGFHAAPRDRAREFLGGKRASVAARIAEMENGAGVLNAGVEAGFLEGGEVRLYETIEALEQRGAASAVATVSASEPGRSILSSGVGAVGWYAAPSSAGRAPILVYLDPGLEAGIAAAVRARAGVGLCDYTDDRTSAVFAVAPSSEGSAIEVRWAAEPLDAFGEPVKPPLVAGSRETTGVDPVAAVANRLRELIRLRRLMTTVKDEHLVGLSYAPFDAGEPAHTGRALVSGESYIARVTNHSTSSLYFQLIESFETDGGEYKGQVITRPILVEAGKTHEFPAARVGLSEGARSELITHLWLATESPLTQIDSLIGATEPDRARSARLSGVESYLDARAMGARGAAPSATPATRGRVGVWAAATYHFEIVAADQSPPATPTPERLSP